MRVGRAVDGRVMDDREEEREGPVDGVWELPLTR